MPRSKSNLLAGKPADGGRKDAGKVRLLTLDDLDGRSRAAQFVRDTRQDVVADMGGVEQLSTLERIAVDNAVLTAAILKDAGIRWLKGEPIDPGTISSLENTFNRTAAALGWKRRARDVTPDIRTYAASTYEAAE